MTIAIFIAGYVACAMAFAVVVSYLSGRRGWNLGEEIPGMAIFWPIVLAVYILAKTIIIPLHGICVWANKRGKDSTLPTANEHPTAKRVDD